MRYPQTPQEVVNLIIEEDQDDDQLTNEYINQIHKIAAKYDLAIDEKVLTKPALNPHNPLPKRVIILYTIIDIKIDDSLNNIHDEFGNEENTLGSRIHLILNPGMVYYLNMNKMAMADRGDFIADSPFNLAANVTGAIQHQGLTPYEAYSHSSKREFSLYEKSQLNDYLHELMKSARELFDALNHS